MFGQIEEATRRLAGIVHHTPVISSRSLDERLKKFVFLKCENLQRTGSVKFRGAYNALAAMDSQERARGVITFTHSGNHGQAVARAAQLMGVPAVVVASHTALSTKLKAIQAYGAELILHNSALEPPQEVAARIAQERRSTLISPEESVAVIAGQGTVGKEIITDTGYLDGILVPCGGGGLLAGVATAMKNIIPGITVIGVEPEQGDDGARSFNEGRLVTLEKVETIADSLANKRLGEKCFPLIQEYVDEIVTVSEQEILNAMYFLWTRLKLVVEPSGAIGLAALFSQKVEMQGKRLGVIISGGNVDVRQAGELFQNMPD